MQHFRWFRHWFQVRFHVLGLLLFVLLYQSLTKLTIEKENKTTNLGDPVTCPGRPRDIIYVVIPRYS
jgi:hypothetical protein